MIKSDKIFSSFSVNDLDAAKEFYAGKLGLKLCEIKDSKCGRMLEIRVGDNQKILIYPKENHRPADFTILNLAVDDIEESVDELRRRGIKFEHFDGNDEKEINHNGGPEIAWFKDPAGNYLSVLKESPLESIKEVNMNMNLDEMIDSRLEKKLFIPESKREVFRYFVTPELLEKWSAPDGMTLEVPQMEANVGGRYRYIHKSDEGIWTCSGQFTNFVPEEYFTSVETVVGPDGSTLFKDLSCRTEFRDVAGGCEVQIVQSGFETKEARDECEQGWDQCLNKLKSLISGDLEGRSTGFTHPEGDDLTKFY